MEKEIQESRGRRGRGKRGWRGEGEERKAYLVDQKQSTTKNKALLEREEGG